MNRLKKFFSDLKLPTTSKEGGQAQGSSKGEASNTAQWKTDDKKAVKILLLGGEQSGKNTLCNQMKLIQLKNPFSDQERAAAASSIRQLIRVSVQAVSQAMVSDGVVLSNSDRQSSLQYCCSGLADPGVCQTKAFYEHVKMLRRDEQMSDYLEKSTNPEVNDNIRYFLDKIEMVAMETYVPSNADMVRCRDEQTRLTNLQVPVTLSRSDLHFSFLAPRDHAETDDQLASILPHAQALLFTVDLHSFPLDDPSSSGHNKLLATMEVFLKILSCRFFPNVHVILLLNKTDKLEETISKGSLFERFVECVDPSHQCYPSLKTWYSWEGPSFDEQKTFIDSYCTKDSEAPVTMDVHQRRASFRKKSSMLQTMMSKKGIQPQTIHTAVFIRRVFADIFTRTLSGRKGDAKPLSVYYTSAIDTYTTKRVFEAWRNTLLIDTV